MTFQARDIDESRYIYDQLAVLAPIMLAITAATPFFKGMRATFALHFTLTTASTYLLLDGDRVSDMFPK